MVENIELGNIVEGKVVKIKPFGAIISLPNNRHGLVHISHISSDFVQDINEYLAVGDTVKVKIISIDPEKSKISLSLKEAAAKPEKEVKQEPRKVFSDKPKQGGDFEDKMKDFLKFSNELQASLNKRNKRR
ncbi:MAG: S1 RNA-binding domain-containing protein [Clostridiales bacterium]|jgi:predicted RNA-binding protein with RPS1 domain|nr:S1 RNA-binding domain-containing protein [Clostridiales bacterium]